MNPLVSICVPTCNRAAALKESLRSICGQDYSPLEVLISDNCSEDETEAVCRAVAADDPRVRYVRQPRNIGLYGNHNFCIEASRGEFLCFFHDHDERDLTIISEYVAFLQDHPEVGIVCSDWDLVNESGALVGSREHRVAAVTPGLQYIGRTVRSGRSSIAAQGALIRRSALGEIRFDETGPIGFGDFVVWFQIAERAAIGHVPRRLWRCRLDRQSQSTRTIASLAEDYRENLTRYCDNHLRRWPEHAALVAEWRRAINRFLFWALAYELGLHFRKLRGGTVHQSHFEAFDYRLTDSEFASVLSELRRYQAGPLQRVTLLMIRLLVRAGLTLPLGWAAEHYTTLRALLGYR